MKTALIKWEKFSNKHIRYIKRALACRMSVAEGAIRSGKTIDHCIIASAYLETCPDRIHLASGSTIANAKMNIGDCNGYGLEHIFRGRCRWGKYKDNECLYLYTQTGEKIVVFAGGGHSDSYKKILGNSYGLWIATEINEHYDADDSRISFVKVAMGRQVASIKPMTLWDLNPSSPHHPIYENYIDKYKQEFAGGYNYEHFTIEDNLAISEQRRLEISMQYNVNSVWYRRDILGMRCVAEGLVYPEYADAPEKYRVSLENALKDVIILNIGVDFGGNGSATAFVATGITTGLKTVRPLFSKRYKERLNPDELNARFVEFVKIVYELWKKPIVCFCDSAEQILIKGLKKAVTENSLCVDVRNALKKPINERIRLTSVLIARKRLEVGENAKTLELALAEAQWNKKKPDERLDDGSTDIDTLDAFEYSIEYHMNDLVRR